MFWVKMSWSSLVIMTYEIYSYVLMSGGVLEITWAANSGQNVPWVVLSVRGCLLWGNSEWECLVLRWGCFGWPIIKPEKYLVVKRNDSCCNKRIIFWNSSTNSKFDFVETEENRFLNATPIVMYGQDKKVFHCKQSAPSIEQVESSTFLFSY